MLPIRPSQITAKKPFQSFGNLIGNFFRKKVADIERASLNIVAPRSPKRDCRLADRAYE